MKKSAVLAIFILAVLGWQIIFAQPLVGEQVVQADVLTAREKLLPGESTAMALKLTIKEGWHINSSKPGEEFLIPTEIHLTVPEGVSIGKLEFPPAEEKVFAFSENPLAVYEGTIYVHTTITIPPDFSGKEVEISGKITYQACNDQTCLPPQDLIFKRKLPVAEPGEKVAATHTEIFQAPAGGVSEIQEESELVKTIESRGMFIAFLVIFISGLALNLTPCVYPLIPITISYFGGQAGGKKGSLLMHAILYVLGMAFTYSVLGLFAALTGSLLGGWLQNPWVLVFIALVMVALALSMFGLFEIRIPTALANFAGQSKQGYFGTLFMGLTVGIIAAPCIGPFVLALLTYVGEKGDPVLGFTMFFVLALGLGIPFIFLAIFSGAINRLPRSGAWMVWVRKIFGFILIAVALYFLNPLIHNTLIYHLALGLTFLVGGIYLAWIEPTPATGNGFLITRNVIGILFLVVAIFLWASGVEAFVNTRLAEYRSQLAVEGQGQSAVQEIQWQSYSPEILQEAQSQQKPIMIDFFADWCIPCKELDKFTFSDPEVIKLSREFLMVKADLTRYNSPEVQQLKNRYQIKGVPTLVFLAPDGTEIPGTRIVGFMDAKKFQKHLLSVLETVQNKS